MGIDFTPLVNAIIGIAATLITSFLLPLMVKKMKQVDRQRILEAVEVVVYAAEKLKLTGMITDKFVWAEEELAKQGIKVSRADIEAFVQKLDIEKAWKDAMTSPDTECEDVMATK